MNIYEYEINVSWSDCDVGVKSDEYVIRFGSSEYTIEFEMDNVQAIEWDAFHKVIWMIRMREMRRARRYCARVSTRGRRGARRVFIDRKGCFRVIPSAFDRRDR